ncbi:MAG: hydrogenase maturation nickel metallochaperone HypA [Gammaproteobacteria bacterium]|jgi:hydrogenase nickel incorporation protein HypA/HybF|nr:hydrogenase maturation nickel metallochaperone HypA [Gammaproteobacteria bacterium]
MHELSICQGLIGQVERIALQHNARAVDKIVVHIGPLSGVEIPLLHQAYSLARAGTRAENAALVTEPQPIRVVCETCGAETTAKMNRLLCGICGEYRTRLVSGDEMILASVELNVDTSEMIQDVV